MVHAVVWRPVAPMFVQRAEGRLPVETIQFAGTAAIVRTPNHVHALQWCEDRWEANGVTLAVPEPSSLAAEGEVVPVEDDVVGFVPSRRISRPEPAVTVQTMLVLVDAVKMEVERAHRYFAASGEQLAAPLTRRSGRVHLFALKTSTGIRQYAGSFVPTEVGRKYLVAVVTPALNLALCGDEDAAQWHSNKVAEIAAPTFVRTEDGVVEPRGELVAVQ